MDSKCADTPGLEAVSDFCIQHGLLYWLNLQGQKGEHWRWKSVRQDRPGAVGWWPRSDRRTLHVRVPGGPIRGSPAGDESIPYADWNMVKETLCRVFCKENN